MSKPRKMRPFTRAWEREADELARSFAPEIYPCAKCGHPVLRGYCCGSCETGSPQTPAARTAEGATP